MSLAEATSNPVRVILEDPVPSHRVEAHLELGRRAAARGARDAARIHFLEAAKLAPDDPRPRQELREVTEPDKRFGRWLFGSSRRSN